MASDEHKVGRPRAKSFDRRRGPMVGLAGFVFFTGGVAAAAVGVATRLQPSLHPYLSEVEWALQRVGLDGVHLLLGGVAIASAGVVLFALRSFSRLLGVDRETAEAIEDLARATTNQAECIEGLESLIAVLRQETAEAHAVLRDQAALLKQREENDPAFRIAASLDQVGARLDRGIVDARNLILDELHLVGNQGQRVPDDSPLLDGFDRVEGTLRELATLTVRFQQALDAAVQPMVGAGYDAGPEPAHAAPSWSDLEPRVSLERYHHSQEQESAPTHDDEPPTDAGDPVDWDAEHPAQEPEEAVPMDSRDEQPEESTPIPPLQFAPPPAFDYDRDGTTTELAIEVELDRAFVDGSDDAVPAPLPAQLPEGLDLLARLDSAHPLEMERSVDAPPLFPDLK